MDFGEVSVDGSSGYRFYRVWLFGSWLWILIFVWLLCYATNIIAGRALDF